jgi:hypothetical protein
MFSMSALKESQASAYYWLSLDGKSDDHLYQQDHRQSFGYNDIIKFFMGMLAR